MKKEVFRVGTFTDASGKTKSFTESDIDEIVKNFDSKKSLNSEGRKVPLFLAHPDNKSEAPALGWVKSVWKDGKSLWAEFEKLTAEAEKAIKNFSFRDVSISMWKKILQHIGLTNTPAVPLLGDFQFECLHKDAETWTFNEGSKMDEKSFFENFKTFFKKEIISDNLNQEDNMDIKELETKFSKLEEKFGTQEAEFNKQAESLTAITTERDDLKAKFEKAEKDIETLTVSIETEKVVSLDAADEQFCAELIKEGKMKPADKEFNLFQLKSLRGAEKREFSIGKEKKTVEPVEVLRTKLSAAPKFSELDELGEGAPESKDDRVTQLAKEKQNKNDGISFSAAVREVLAENPTLNVEAK